MHPIYLDHNSTTPQLAEVTAAMAECQASAWGNPASQHQAGRNAHRLLEDARDAIGQMLGADTTGREPDQVIFTSGGTEANNLALLGLAAARGATPGEAVISAIEHPSVSGPAEHLERSGWRIRRLGVSRDGVVDVDQLADLLNPNTRFVTVMLGNNETGALQPIQELAALCNQAGVPLHTDAVQVVGKLPVDFRSLGVSTLSAAAHKFHGPKGIGALVVRHGIALRPILFGGFQQAGLRPGTECVSLAVGMRRALEIFVRQQEARAAAISALRNRLESALKAGYPRLVVNAAGAPRLPHTSNVSFRGLDRRALLMALDLAGVACSSGSACASGSSEPSPVLLAMGCDKETVAGSLRFSLGATTTAEEIDEAVRRILAVTRRLDRSAESMEPLVEVAGG